MEKSEYQRLFTIENKHWWYQSIHQLIINQFLSLHPLHKPKILDAGCGTGGLTAKLASFGQIIGLDFSSLALHLARRRRLTLLLGSVNSLPFKTSRFDAVLSISVLCQNGVNQSTALAEIYRILKPKSFLILVLPAFQNLYSHHDIAVHTRERYTLPQITRRLRQAGFRRIKGHYIFSFLFPAFVLKRLVEKIFKLKQTISDLTLPLPTVNNFLKQLCFLEWRISRYLPLPFGSSIFITAYKS